MSNRALVIKAADLPRQLRRKVHAQAPDPESERTRKRARREQLQREAEERAATFKVLCSKAGLPLPVREHRFAWETLKRKWEIDFAWIEERLALEVEGGVWTRGRHTRGAGFLGDMAKYNQLTLHGWRLVRVTPKDLCTAATIDMLRALLQPQAAKAS